jgi:hypothetical protein
MLDALKFAFEILIVGALALPWLEVLYRMFPDPDPLSSRFDLSFVPEGARNVVSVAIVLAVGYLLGSAVSRFSRDFFNDELWQPLPTEDVIRDSVYFDEFCAEQSLAYTYWSQPIHLAPLPNFCPANPKGTATFSGLSAEENERFHVRVQEVFRLEDSELLLQGVDKVDRLKQYFDQITVLRGAALNAFILFALALFGSLGRLKERWSKYPVLVFLTFLPSALAGIYTLYSLWRHWYHGARSVYSDPPLAEIVILLLSAVGMYVVLKPEKKMPYFRICTIAVIVMVVSFGGWWWTEVTYDLQVIHSLAEIKESGGADRDVAQPLNKQLQLPPPIEHASPAPAGAVPRSPQSH